MEGFMNTHDSVSGYDVYTRSSEDGSFYYTEVIGVGDTQVYYNDYVTREDAQKGHKEVLHKIIDGKLEMEDV